MIRKRGGQDARAPRLSFAAKRQVSTKPVKPVPKTYLEGGAPAPPQAPVFLTIGTYGPQPAAVSVRHVFRPCGSMALQKILRVLRKISEIRGSHF